MTLCVVWRNNDAVHFASDSRLTLAANSYADVGIKVLSLPYRIYSPRDRAGDRSMVVSGELGMCFAGSAVNSLVLKESVSEVLKELQYAPGFTDISMGALAELIFNAYQLISTKLCATAIGCKGRAAIVVAGWCAERKQIRTFLFETSDVNVHRSTEILTKSEQHVFVGSGIENAEGVLPTKPTDLDYLKVLKKVIDDQSQETVGGAIQYGYFQGCDFKIRGIVEIDEGVHYWRGALDLNSPEFMGKCGALIPGISYIDPFAGVGFQ